MDAPNILVIDGDPKNLQILKESLEASSFRVTTCDDGSKAWGIIQAKRPDIIVSEVDIPGLNGLELLEKIQKDPVAAAIPLVFLTNRRNIEDRLKSLRSGVKDYMIKPLHVKEVIARLHMILRRIERLRHEEMESNKKVVGRLEEKSVESLVQDYGLQRKTGVLSLYDENNRSGEIYFRDGTVVNARLGNFKAEKAVYQMLPWDHGHYVMDFREISVKDEITVSNLGLLVQGVKQLQERANLLKQLPELDSIFVRAPIFEQILKRKSIAPDALKFVALFDGQRSLNDILAESTFDDIKTLEKIIKLYLQGFVKPLNGEHEVAPAKTSDSTVTIPVIETKSVQPPPPIPKPVETEPLNLTFSKPQKPGANGIKDKAAASEKPRVAPPPAPSAKPDAKVVAKEIKVEHTVANNGPKKETPAPKPAVSKLGVVFDQLFNGHANSVGRFVVISADADSRKSLISILSQNSFLSKSLDQNDSLSFEFAKINTPDQHAIEILGVSTERRFLQMLEQVSSTLIGYVVLIGDQNLTNLGYAGYLMNSLKRQFPVPHLIVMIQSNRKRTIPLDVVRYTLKLEEKEQLLEIDVRDPESVKHLLQQLQSPVPHQENNGQANSINPVSHPDSVFR